MQAAANEGSLYDRVNPILKNAKANVIKACVT